MLTKEEIEKLEEVLTKEDFNKDILPEKLKETIEENIDLIFTNDIVLARVFLMFYSIFENNLEKFNLKELNKEIAGFWGIDYLRDLFFEYDGETAFGRSYYKHKIKNYVNRYRKNCISLINLGKEIFFEELI